VNPTGPITQNFGLTPEQSAELFTRVFKLLREMPAAREVLIGAKASLVDARQQIKLLAEYKGVHDLLQQLELSYRVVYDLTFQDDNLLPAERVSWRGLSSSQNALQTTIAKVCDFVATVSFAADADEWSRTLQTARGQLQAAYERRDIETLGAAVTDVADVVGGQTSRMNDRLIGALDALGLERLIGVLRRSQEEMARVPADADATLPRRLERFAGDLAGLKTLAARLKELRDAHDAWQQADNDLRSEQALLGLSLDRFRRRWEKLARELRALCDTDDAPWGRDLAAAIAKMEAALGPNAAADPMDAFYDCRSAVIQRFNQVDHNLKTLCDLLKEAGGPLDTMLDGLA
jgi:hypothetical protein